MGFLAVFKVRGSGLTNKTEVDETRCRNMADALEEIANYLRR